MLLIAMLCFMPNPFYEANFTPLPIRSLSVFANPAGLGIRTGAEAFGAYYHDTERIDGGVCASNLGFGVLKDDTITNYRIAVGYKLPGAFSLGYAYDFGDTSSHVLGVQCRPSEKLALGYKTTLGSTMYMYAGIGIMPYQDYIVLNFEVEYEGIEEIFDYYFGARLQPYPGVSASFISDEDWHWHAGLELSFGYVRVCGLYSHEEQKWSAGVLLSAQRYPGVMP